MLMWEGGRSFTPDIFLYVEVQTPAYHERHGLSGKNSGEDHQMMDGHFEVFELLCCIKTGVGEKDGGGQA